MQKIKNKIISIPRVFVEHVFCGTKRFRCVHDVLRMSIDNIKHDLMSICCGLHNLKIGLNPWMPMPEPGC